MNTHNQKQQNLEQSYHQVVTLYDLADDLISAVDTGASGQQQNQFNYVNPLVEQLEETADVLTEEFINLAENHGKATSLTGRARIEAAFRKIYSTLEQYGQGSQKGFEAITATINPLMDKIKHHVDTLITIFIGFVDLALDRIMQKTELESLKKREAAIADFLQRMSSTAKTS